MKTKLFGVIGALFLSLSAFSLTACDPSSGYIESLSCNSPSLSVGLWWRTSGSRLEVYQFYGQLRTSSFTRLPFDAGLVTKTGSTNHVYKANNRSFMPGDLYDFSGTNTAVPADRGSQVIVLVSLDDTTMVCTGRLP